MKREAFCPYRQPFFAKTPTRDWNFRFQSGKYWPVLCPFFGQLFLSKPSGFAALDRGADGFILRAELLIFSADFWFFGKGLHFIGAVIHRLTPFIGFVWSGHGGSYNRAIVTIIISYMISFFQEEPQNVSTFSCARYCNASSRASSSSSCLPARSATVRATRRMRSWARAERPSVS